MPRYITNNPTRSKEVLNRAVGDLEYHGTHEKYHHEYRRVLYENGLYDIFVFSTDGDLLYSVFKELDYATNFLHGKYALSGLGKAFRAAIAKPSAVSSTKFEPYAPSNGAMASFVATGIMDDSGKVA